VKVLNQESGEGWSLINGDSAEVLPEIPTDSIHYSVYSPPFASLLTYSDSPRDMSNVRDYEEFWEHFGFLMPELFRATKPGRVMSVHCMALPTSKTRDGRIGLRDFPGDIIRNAEKAGWIWHSRVVIFKDPIVAAQRTKSIGLLYKQLLKDSCMSRMGIPDEVLTFRKPGENPERVGHTKEEMPLQVWQRWAEPIWDDIDQSDTLNVRAAREERDEAHLCPLQLEVIRRCIRLWSNPGDVVLTPFLGIGSECAVAVEEGRKAFGIELKPSYFAQACANLRAAYAAVNQPSIFDLVPGGPS